MGERFAIDVDPETYLPIIKNRATKYAPSILPRDASLTYDDIVSQGYVFFYKLLGKIEEENEKEESKKYYQRALRKYPFEQVLVTWLNGCFINWVNYFKSCRWDGKTIPLEEELADRESYADMDDFFDLSEDAQAVVRMLIEGPVELMDFISNNWRVIRRGADIPLLSRTGMIRILSGRHGQPLTRKLLTQFLKTRLGWSPDRIRMVWEK
jgi:hypothetical protein